VPCLITAWRFLRLRTSAASSTTTVRPAHRRPRPSARTTPRRGPPPPWRMTMIDFRTAARPAFASTLLALALAACSVGPDYVRPQLPTPEAFGAMGADSKAPAVVADDRFWRDFGDPLLAQLVEDALAANHDLRIAFAGRARAHALLRGARRDALPTVTANAEGAASRPSSTQAPGLPRAERDGDSYSAGIAAGWERDLFRRLRRRIEAGRAEALAS